jgi:hypothetical protein
MIKTWGPFTGRQLTTIAVAIIIGVVMLPSAVWAVDTFSNVAIQDPVSGAKASVDATNHLKVGDGSGALTVDGTVASRPASPSKVWSAAGSATSGTYTILAGPSATGIEVTSLSAISTSDVQLWLRWEMIPNTATACPQNFGNGTNYQMDLPSRVPLVATFPTPIQLRPGTGQKVCLIAAQSGAGTISLNASGYYD